MSRKRRALSGDDRSLWDRVRQTAVPLRPEPEPEPPSASPAPPKPERKKEKIGNAPPATVAKPAPQPQAQPTILDRRTRNRLSRGILDVDARIDLHGLTQSLAHRKLRNFIEEAQAGGARLVLVITGKGAPAERGDFMQPQRGVLRRAVPQWLASQEFRDLVAGFDEAGRRHGGEGAIYVRIRRRRGAP
jgi:DNA-nicking Smr family endonuclease